MTEPTRPTAPIALLADARRAILSALKKVGRATIPWLAETLNLSTEAVRQQVWQLQEDGWLISDCGTENDASLRARGRPPAEYCLAPIADDLFPKNYAEVAVALFDDAGDIEKTLTRFTDDRVEKLDAKLPRTPLERRIRALRSIYIPDDEFTDVEKSERGYRLTERNCPYLQFAMERPLFCSTTVSALRRLTDREVVREQRFQDGDRRCVFHIYTDSRAPKKRFEHEPPKDAKPRRS